MSAQAKRRPSAPRKATGKRRGARSTGSGPGAAMPVGPHVSVAGDLASAFENGAAVGATAIQIFTRNQRQWTPKPLAEDEVARFREAWSASPIGAVMSHDSYLINLGSPEPDKLARSRRAFIEEARRCSRLGIRLLNFHPGARMGASREQCLGRIAEGVRLAMDAVPDPNLQFVIENTAGQGSVVGDTLEDLAELIERIGGGSRAGICLDTCHLYAAGHDIRGIEGWESFWREFDRTVGLRLLRAFHLNDAKQPLGSRADRHEALGQGTLGEAFFRRLAQDPRFLDIPMFLETPGPEAIWAREVALLRRFRARAAG